jgi:hypothetical protein
MGSDAYHAVSETNVLGPYVRKDYVYTSGSSHKGHNVSAAELPDGSYVVIVSEIVPFQLFKSTSLDGPWTGCSPQSDVGASNISMFPRHDGKFQIVERHGQIAISDTLCGHYVKKTPTCAYTQSSDAAGTVYPKRSSIPNVSNPQFTWQEDPHIWRSGGTYHIVYSGSGDRVGWHLYSPDGISWKDNGYAWSPRDYKKIFCYQGSDHCDAWYKMERPGVVLQDGHPTHMTWAVADVDKDNQVTPGTNHGTKVVVIPFDGVAFDTDFGDGSTGGTGGNTGTGGTSGAGGTTGTGGTTASGGAKGGSSAAGGTTSGGGTTTSGTTSGVAGTTGTKPTAGTTSTSSSTPAGGNTGTGGKAGSTTTSGGAGAGGSVTSSAAGGSSSSSSSSSKPSGGSSSAGGASTSGGASASTSEVASGGKSGGSSTSISTAKGGDSGCSIALGSHRAALPGLFLGALGLMLLRRRNRNRR